ncbi:DUF86 domain-containing protein [Xylanibacillus composti]|uniref:DUF86 domain-containing protein n=1 Tax=Xylanibacillus composti TaxID=1572762 RepID=A0A8J4M0U1_9BACL|nr:HepT-like ribonuclease domain-containing protein [Xylanibacillus composti]MDT9724910.1 DUF86 domain-containing protein [Xylanibacillus composti]GIQ68145.1 hypothetical protein XYCOK13_09690 [Xylanibacillus composti]
MYYVNIDQIEKRLDFSQHVGTVARRLAENAADPDPVLALSRERVLQLAIELVTDVGSYLIDGFMMRDAGSYEDIVEVLQGEEVLDDRLAEALVNLVKWRKPLMQQYMDLPQEQLSGLIPPLGEQLQAFAEQVRQFLQRNKDLL